MKNEKKPHSRFISFCMTTVACLLLLCVAYTFVIFKTDTVINVDEQSAFNSANFDRTDVTTSVLDANESDDGSGGGNGGGSNPPPGVPTPQPTPITPDASKKAIYDFLKSLNYDDIAIAGIMGNMEHESGCLPGTTQSHTHDDADNTYCYSKCNNYNSGNAHGIVQWDGGRRAGLINSAVKANVSWCDLTYQLAFMENELSGSYGTWCGPSTIMKDCTSTDDAGKVEYACYRWCRYYEVCAGVKKGDTYASRVNYSGWNERLSHSLGFYNAILNGDFN